MLTSKLSLDHEPPTSDIRANSGPRFNLLVAYDNRLSQRPPPPGLDNNSK